MNSINRYLNAVGVLLSKRIRAGAFAEISMVAVRLTLLAILLSCTSIFHISNAVITRVVAEQLSFAVIIGLSAAIIVTALDLLRTVVQMLYASDEPPSRVDA